MYQDTLNKIRATQNAIAQAENDQDYSPEGRAKRVASLRTQLANLRGESLSVLEVEWAKIKSGYRSVEARKRAAQAKAASSWDFSRLEYESAALRARVAALKSSVNTLAGDVDPLRQIESEYNAVMAGDDRHMKRTWAEIGAGLVAEFFSGQMTHGLAKRMARDLAEVTTTDEIKRLEAEGKALVEQALPLQRAHAEIKNIFYPSNLGNTTEFDKLVENVRLTSRVDAETLGTVSVLEVV